MRPSCGRSSVAEHWKLKPGSNCWQLQLLTSNVVFYTRHSFIRFSLLPSIHCYKKFVYLQPRHCLVQCGTQTSVTEGTLVFAHNSLRTLCITIYGVITLLRSGGGTRSASSSWPACWMT